MRISVAVFALVFTVAAARAQTPPAPAPSSPSAAEASIHGYGAHDKTCLAWTDRCRNCTRGANDEATCSNIGIACQPQAIACTQRRPEPKQTEPKQTEPKQTEPKQTEPKQTEPKQTDPAK